MVVAAKSGVLNLTDGQVFLNDQAVESTVTHYPDVKEGNTLRTEDGRAEVLLTPGVVLRLGDHASLKMVTNRLIDTRLELLSGSAVVEADDIAKDTSVSIVLHDASVNLPKAGLYRFDSQPLEVKVFKGEAAVGIGNQTTLVGPGRMAVLSGGEATVQKFDTEDTDALDRWSHRRGEMMAVANVSTAKSLLNSGSYPGVMSLGVGGLGCSPYWGYNTYFAMMTFVPCVGSYWSPYGYPFWSPMTVSQAFVRPPTYFGGRNSGGYAGGYAGYRGFSTAPLGRAGYAGSMGARGYSGATAGSAASAPSASVAGGHVGGGSVGGGSVGGGAGAGHAGR
jgi:hypothetical protein